jgi:hypothetical protein
MKVTVENNSKQPRGLIKNRQGDSLSKSQLTLSHGADQCFGSGTAFNLGLDPDPYSESGSGFRIQMSKNGFKKPKFTMTDFKDKNKKMFQLS